MVKVVDVNNNKKKKKKKKLTKEFNSMHLEVKVEEEPETKQADVTNDTTGYGDDFDQPSNSSGYGDDFDQPSIEQKDDYGEGEANASYAERDNGWDCVHERELFE